MALVYGGGSIKKNGIYESVAGILKAEGKTVTEIAGVMPNPTIHKLYEGVEAARQNKVDFILAEGKTDIQMAKEGLDAMEAWMKELRLAMNLSEVGVTPDMIEDIVNGTLIMEGGRCYCKHYHPCPAGLLSAATSSGS